MRILLTILLSIFLINISLAQTGWGYVNYTSYRTHNGNGSINQYTQFANNAVGFDVMFNTANSNTTIFRRGEVTLAAMASGSSTVPKWAGDYYGFKFEFWFVPQETGTYRFGINSDDASDLFINGVVVSTYYGGHGASAYQYGVINLVAGQRYFIVARMQEYGGGDAFFLHWSRPSAPNTYSYWNNEVTNVNSEPTKKVRMNFDFGSVLDKTKLSIGSALSSTGWIDITTLLDSNKISNQYKPQSVTMTTVNNLPTLYNSIVTITDVYLAFKELQNGGIFGNQNGNEFTYGIQYKNADVNDDGYFNEADCFALLQYLTGIKNLVDTFNLKKTLKLIPQSTYETIGKSNWASFQSYLGDVYGFNINTGNSIDTFYIKGTWKGDVNLSHSATPTSNGITTMSANFGIKTQTTLPTAYIVSEIKGDSLIAYIKFNPNSNQIVGTQFQINYDNTILKYTGTDFRTTGSPINFGTDKDSYINLGSINTSGELLDGSTEYRLGFKLNKQIPNSLGLLSIASNEAVNVNGSSMKIKIQ